MPWAAPRPAVTHTARPAGTITRCVSAEVAYGQGPAASLADCYRSSLAVADELGARSVAFPLISAGAYGWPREDAIRIALTTLAETPSEVPVATLVLFDSETHALAERLRG